ncbi:MAG: hypothetical protein HOC70_02270 [Gammaproteobacteria bacterium]|nr:hypothetical protein [Gammaproteobacteria bacterium]
MKKPMSLLIICAISMSALSSTARADAYGSGWYGELQASYGHEDNITRTYHSDELSDEIASVSIGGGYSRKIRDNSQLILSAYLIYNRHRDWEALNSFGVSLGLDYTIQPRMSYNAPWYNIKLTATNLEYKDSNPREGVLVNADLSVNKRLTTALTGHLGYRYKDLIFVGKSDAEEKNDTAFDTDSQEIYLGLDYAIGISVYFFGEYAYRHGDVRSTVSGGLATGDKYDAETIDNVFDPPCTRRCNWSYAYRQKGDTQLATLGVAFPVKKVYVDVAASYFEAKGDNGKTYEDWLIKLGLLWNF